jgi:hypothetical protein
MVRFKTAVWLAAPDVAVTVTFDVPAEAEAAAVNFPRKMPDPLDGANEAVTPAGSPTVDSTMFAGIPVIAVMDMAVVPASP